MRLAKFEYSVDPLKNKPEHSLGSKDGTEEKKKQNHRDDGCGSQG